MALVRRGSSLLDVRSDWTIVSLRGESRSLSKASSTRSYSVISADEIYAVQQSLECCLDWLTKKNRRRTGERSAAKVFRGRLALRRGCPPTKLNGRMPREMRILEKYVLAWV